VTSRHLVRPGRELELTVMVGGDPAGLERARPVLYALAAKVFHVGTLGMNRLSQWVDHVRVAKPVS
jgi:hypothetical protein